MQIAAVYGAFFFTTVILRKHWVENERLSFPLVQLPMEMIEQPRALLHSAPMWLGFCTTAGIFLVNGLHQSFPTLPYIPLELWITENLPEAMRYRWAWTALELSPAVVGFSFLLPLDVTFSLWFFYLVGKAQELYLVSINANVPFEHAGAEGHVAYEAAGAFVALAGVTLYSARHHLRHVLLRATRRARAAPDECHEMVSYPVAVWGLVASLAAVVGWAIVFGMSWYIALLEFGVYLFVMVIVMGRCTAEGGLIVTEGSFTPTDLALLGQRQLLGPQQLTMLTFYDGLYARDLRGVLFTAMMDTQKVGEQSRVWGRRLRALMIGGIALAVLCALCVQTWLSYHEGGLRLYNYTYSWCSTQFFRENTPIMSGITPKGRLSYAPYCVAGGFLACLALTWLRWRMPAVPIHPLGYAMSATWVSVFFWFSFFVGWLIKSLVLRYGGLDGFRRLRPFFLGAIFGEFFSARAWSAARLLWGVSTPPYPWP